MNRRLALLTGGYFVVIGIIVIAVLPFAVDVLHIETTIEHQLDPAQADARALLSAALDQETGERGYVITPDPAFLEPYTAGVARAVQVEGRLRLVHLDGAERNALRDTISALQAWQQQHADPVIALVRAGRLNAARAASTTTTGKTLFDTFREKHTHFVDLVASRLDSKRNQLHTFSILAILALVLASAISLVSAILFRAWVRAATERAEQGMRERIAFSEVHRLSSVLAAAQSSSDVAIRAAIEAARVLDASDAHVWTLQGSERLVLAGSTDTFAGAGLTPSLLSRTDHNGPADAFRRDDALFFGDESAYAAAFPGWAPALEIQHAAAVAIMPTRSDRGPVGVLEVFYASPQEFDDGQRTLLELIADQIGNALGRAQAREREHEAAAKLQESLLGPPLLVDGAGHTSRYLPAEATLHIGGDWHNAQRLADGRIVVAVGDVVGRGLEAATIMGQLRSAVSACALRCPTPSDLLECLDEFAAEIPGAESTTVGIAFLDVQNQTLDYVSAGHPPPVLVAPDGQVRLLDDAVTWPLAVGPARPRALGRRVEFPPGSMIVLYSDGLVERRREALDDGIARLMHSIADHWNQPLDILSDNILSDVLRDRRRDDDIALLVMRSPVSNRDVFLMKVRASAEALGRVRERLRAWLEALQLSPDDQLAVLVAAGEACTNAIEHAYTGGIGNLFRVEATCDNGDIVCCITDTGGWKDNAARSARGNGLTIMRELMDDVIVERRASGTSVTLRYRPGVRNRSAVIGSVTGAATTGTETA